jgi:CHASE2 domain-containing sensor protein
VAADPTGARTAAPGTMGAVPTENDPVRARRAQVAKWSLLANRVGYLLFAVSFAVFVIGFALGFTPPLVTVVVATLVVGSILLAPSIVLGYAVKAAEREDRERGL